MTETGQTEFIGNIKKALKRKNSSELKLEDIIQSVPDSADLRLLENIRSRGKEMRLSLFNQLAETGRLLNMVVTTKKDLASAAASILRIAVEKKSEWGDKKSVVAWDHPLVRSLDLSTRLQAHDIPIYYPDIKPGVRWQKEFTNQAANSFIGITSADYCIAATATLTMKTRVGQPRCVSLLPSIHIAVIKLEQILSRFERVIHAAKMGSR